jgi:hypothetical protein
MQMKKLWGIGAVVALFIGGSLMGQLSQSGGTGTAVTATLTQGGNTAQVTAASALKVDGSAVTQPVSGTLTTVPKTACGSTSFDSGMTAVPTTSTAVTSTATCVNAIVFVNTTGSAQTVSVTDNQATPMSYLSSFQIPANSTFIYDLQFVKMSAGIKWSAANASSVNAQIVGFQ